MLTVLIVEDSSTLRKLIVFALKRVEGLTVVEADDGVDALRKTDQTHFDLIITDINMPVMDGLKLISRLREHDWYRAIPILILTTEGATDDRNRGLELGANAYITKPIRAPQVVAKVKELLHLP